MMLGGNQAVPWGSPQPSTGCWNWKSRCQGAFHVQPESKPPWAGLKFKVTLLLGGLYHCAGMLTPELDSPTIFIHKSKTCKMPFDNVHFWHVSTQPVKRFKFYWETGLGSHSLNQNGCCRRSWMLGMVDLFGMQWCETSAFNWAT